MAVNLTIRTGADERVESAPASEHPGVESVVHAGIEYARIIRADTQVDQTTFFSNPESSFQFGLLAHPAGFIEPPHRHRGVIRTIDDVQQMFVVQRGKVAVQLYSDEGDLLREVVLGAGDAVVLIHGIHAVRVIEDLQCISVKQGPFLGTKYDKQFVSVKK
jgi:hypothetical protein